MKKDAIKLLRKNVYGRELIYPGCEASHLLVKLTGRKTFDQSDLKTLSLLGFEIILSNEV